MLVCNMTSVEYENDDNGCGFLCLKGGYIINRLSSLYLGGFTPSFTKETHFPTSPMNGITCGSEVRALGD